MTVPEGPPPVQPGRRATLLLSMHDHVHHRSLVTEILKRARRFGLSGATVFQAEQGYGASGQVHRAHLLSNDAPVVIVVVDQPDRIDAFLQDAADLLERVLVTVSDLAIVTV